MRRFDRKSRQSTRRSEKTRKTVRKRAANKRSSNSISIISNQSFRRAEFVQNVENKGRIHERNSTAKAPTTSCLNGNDLEPEPNLANEFALPIFRQVPPLSPIKSAGRNSEIEVLQKRHERLEAEEKMLIRQDRIWQNEQKRIAVLKKTPNFQSNSEVPSDLKLIVHRRIPYFT